MELSSGQPQSYQELFDLMPNKELVSRDGRWRMLKGENDLLFFLDEKKVPTMQIVINSQGSPAKDYTWILEKFDI